MRKLLASVLVGLGAFLLVTAALAQFWSPGKVEKTPTDINSTTRLSGQAQKLNLTTGKTEDLPVKVTVRTKADPKRSTDNVVAWVQTTCVVIDKGNVPNCVTDQDPQGRLINASIDTFATDRHTGLAVANADKYVLGPAEPHVGLVNKFPFGTQKKTYPMWDSTLKQSTPAEFQDVETLQGLEVYKFHVMVDPVKAQIADGVDGIYSLDKSIWVEPRTGSIVNQTQHDVRKLPDGSTALDLDVAFTPDQVTSGVKDGKAGVSQLKLITQTVPLVGLVGGLLLLGAGILMFLRGGRKPRPTAGDRRAARNDDVVPGLS